MDEEALAARFEEGVWHSEIPLPDLNGMGRLALAEAVHAQGIKVVITGELSSTSHSVFSLFSLTSFFFPSSASLFVFNLFVFGVLVSHTVY